MEKTKLQIEICADSGCSLIVADSQDKQLRVSMLPDEVLEARNIFQNERKEAFSKYIIEINPKFNAALSEISIENIIEVFNKKTNFLK